MSKFKAFAGNPVNVAKMARYVFNSAENIKRTTQKQGRCTGSQDITKIQLKTVLNIIQSVKQPLCYKL